MNHVFFCCSIIICVLVQANCQTTATFDALKDNTIYENDGTLSNGAGSILYAGQTRRFLSRRALLKFDVSTIPTGANITAVALKTYCNRTVTVGTTATLHRVLKGWGEQTATVNQSEGQGSPAAPGDATWTHNSFSFSTWASVGGDYAPIASASKVVDEGIYVHWSSATINNDVQDWISGSPNHGWIIIGDESLLGSILRFNSRENPDNPPILEISYTVPSLCSNTNQTLQGQIPSGTYQASQQISIDAGIVTSGSSVTVRAGSCILVSADSELNGETELIIGPCQ